jgi:HlyD family secretion protein
MTRRAVWLAVLVMGMACRPSDEGAVRGVGTLEAIDEDVAPVVTARVSAVRVQEGDTVALGDTIAVLELPTLAAQQATAAAAVGVARAALAELVAGTRVEELDAARAALALADAELARAVDDSQRVAPVVAAALSPPQALVTARQAVRAAQARRDAAAAALALAVAGPRPERLAAARAELARAEAVAAQLDATARDLVLTARAAGTVIGRHLEPGEVAPAGRAIVTLATTQRPWVRVYLGPQHLPLVQLGDSVEAVLDAFPDAPVMGVVTAIATRAEYTPRVALTEQERADQLFGVRVEFADASGRFKAGLPVTVTFARPRGP